MQTYSDRKLTCDVFALTLVIALSYISLNQLNILYIFVSCLTMFDHSLLLKNVFLPSNNWYHEEFLTKKTILLQLLELKVLILSIMKRLIEPMYSELQFLNHTQGRTKEPNNCQFGLLPGTWLSKEWNIPHPLAPKENPIKHAGTPTESTQSPMHMNAFIQY